MINRWNLMIAILLVFVFLSCSNKNPIEQSRNSKKYERKPYPEEIKAKINRGLVALPKEKKQIFLSWRNLPGDPKGCSYEVLRKTNDKEQDKLESAAIVDKTAYSDHKVEIGKRYIYAVRWVKENNKGPISKLTGITASAEDRRAISIDIGEAIGQARVVTGDLTGDGEMEIVAVHSKNWDIDPNKKWWKKSEDTIKVTAFRKNGSRLWQIDLGWGIEAGGNYSPIVLWDLDADGRSEVVLKTNKSNNPKEYKSERLTLLEGVSGKIIREVSWPTTQDLGGQYNNDSRNFLAIAHLDGKNPYIIAARGIYNTQRIWAYDNQLNFVWERVIGRDNNALKNILNYKEKIKRVLARIKKDRNHGSHSLPVADIDDDGKEEILWGEHCLDEYGKDKWIIERTPYRGHPDVVFVADIFPSNPGKEIYYCREGWYSEKGKKKKSDKVGLLVADNKGQTIWAKWGFFHVDGGWAGRLIPGKEKMQFYAFDLKDKKISEEGGEQHAYIKHYLFDSEGETIGNPDWHRSIPLDWDGDGYSEVCLKNGDVIKYENNVVFKAQPDILWCGDIFGDHREELLQRQKTERYTFISIPVNYYISRKSHELLTGNTGMIYHAQQCSTMSYLLSVDIFPQ
jgi:hypothetical protein